MSKLDKVFKSIEKYQGKPTKISVTNNDGEIEEFNIYPLPNKFLPLLLKAQELSKDESKKIDMIGVNQDLVNCSLAYSLCIDKGEMTYREVAEMSEQEFEQVKKAVGQISSNHFQKFMEGIMKANEVGDEEKKQ